MPKAIFVRALTPEETKEVQRLAHSRTEPARAVERAQIVLFSCEGLTVPAIAKQLRRDAVTVRMWVKRFNAMGLAGLQDLARPGHPATYTSEQVSEIVAAALTPPRDLGLPFASWTLDRLQAYLSEVKGVAMKRSRIDEILLAEGLRWRKQETWFGERVDPEFAEKRGA
jgi:transposase